MKIIHCADLHIDSKLDTHFEGRKLKERKDEILMNFDRMVDFAKSDGVSAILISGDMFDSVRVSTLTKKNVLYVISTHPDITFFYLKGNHDCESFLSPKEPEKRQELPANIRLFGDEWMSYELADGRVVIYGLELLNENSKGAGLKLVTDPEKYNIVMLHGQEGTCNPKDKTEVINLNEFKNRGIDYLALGHVHTYKTVRLDSRAVYCYSGCLEGRGFDECGEHGFVLMDIDTSGTVVSCKRSFILFAKRTVFELGIDVSECANSSQIIKLAKEAVKEKGCHETDMVQIRLVGKTDINSEKDVEYIENSLKDDFYYLKVVDETGIRIDYEALKHDISLKGEFVRLVCEDTTLSEEERARILETGINAINGEK